jgi:cellulose synthase (UDP-forming)
MMKALVVRLSLIAPIQWLWMAAAVIFLWAMSIPIHYRTEQLLGVGLLGLLVFLVTREVKKESPNLIIRIVIIFTASFITLRYFYWRVFNTLPDIAYEPISFFFAFLLLLAESYGFLIYLLGAFVNIRPLKRKPVILPKDTDLWPTVDILVPSYNEDIDILEVTLMAATQLNYPRHRFNVYMCDDGGTEQRRNHSNPEIRASAHKRFHDFQALCADLGVHYRTRAKNEHAKAGNLNSVLQTLTADLVLILDADHVPTDDILMNTVGLFLEDPKLFLVQTPHNFLNPDPIERNLGTFGHMPGENEMFYGVIQYGLDFWGASFFCGSAAVLRRKYLMEIGGISGKTITEDAETAMDLHAMGYHSAYIGTPMVAGLQPETFSGFVVQRVRWAQGMIQIFLLKNPWLRPNMSVTQRLAYTSSSGFWFFPFARMAFFCAPILYFVFGLNIYHATIPEMIAYAIPHLFASWWLSNYLFGKVRWPFISELYETMQAVFSFPAIIEVFMNPTSPEFKVTPKGEHLEDDFISQLAMPFYILITLNVVSLMAGAFRWVYQPIDQDVIIMVGMWTLFDLVLLVGAIGVLFERKQRRASPRLTLPVSLPVKIDSAILPPLIFGEMLDISQSGAAIELTFSHFAAVEVGMRFVLRARELTHSVYHDIPVEIASVQKVRHGSQYYHVRLGVRFKATTQAQRRGIVAILYGSSQQLQAYLEQRHKRQPISGSFLYLVRITFRRGLEHIIFLFRSGLLKAALFSLFAKLRKN